MKSFFNFLNPARIYGNNFASRFLCYAGIKTCLLLLLLLGSPALYGQAVKLEGTVKDTDGETLPFATILILPDSIILPVDGTGSFYKKVLPGAKDILITYTGTEVLRSTFYLQNDTILSFTISPQAAQLREVTITASRYSQEHLVQSARSGTITLTQKDITAMPVLGGEADIIKALQLLPGTVRGVEGSSDMFVRGGAADQNLVLLDGATIYNSSHLFGFLSVFNPDILDRVEAVHGGFPAEFGGRLSSILDISSNSRIAQKTSLSANIGLIASRVYVEQPLIADKLSVWVGGRRTYIDQVFALASQELPYFFYDLNGKMIFKPGRRDQVEISYYGGKDIFDFSRQENDERFGLSSTYASGNNSQSVQWRHNSPQGWRSKLALTRTSFQYDIRNSFGDHELNALSNIEDYGAKVIFEKDSTGRAVSTKAGIEWTRHAVSPNIINSSGFFTDFLESSITRGQLAHEAAAFVQQEWLLSRKLLVSTGFRGSFALLQNKEYFTPEPRLSFRYKIREHQSVKLSYARMAQYMHRISNSGLSSPTDIWYPVTDSIPPQRSHQFSAAWQKFLGRPKVFLSAEAYYKSMDNLIGYEEGTNLFFNTDFKSKLIQGQGTAYGLEFLLRKEAGKLTGWLSYTLSWSRRQFDAINQGQWFPSRYDRRHNGAIVMQYALSRRWAASTVWEFISGARFTPIIGQYILPAPALTGVDLIPVYAGINQVKLSDSHRLDLGLKFMSKAERKFSWQVFAGVNNAYNRASPIGIFIEQDENDGSLRYVQPGLFGLLPFVNFGFRF